MLGRSPALAAARVQIERAAALDVPILLLGESGTGKELAAREIHARSPRARGPFVAVNLAALPSTLVEDELFGHVAGAYTGATSPRSGRFRRADGGTLFLDEIGDIPLPVQAKLLRVLEEGTVEPLGAETTETVDVRIVAATHRDLGGLVAKGTFRSDLFFRLAVVPVELPPLRERADDVAVLARHFAKHDPTALPPRGLTDAALEKLCAHPWPGNVRELENAIHRARVLAQGKSIDAPDLAFLEDGRDGAAQQVAAQAVRRGLRLPDLTRAILEESLRVSHGNETEAARRVGLTRRAFAYRRKKRG